ncbi:hypothetical protein SO694_00044278 [Aureococcus anophagefferens]|uniref:RxLR effector protein n=1 Tax=Aureococcus anophagefferens TaxID=44056 RepID=A0ABR1G7Z7_AURAN
MKLVLALLASASAMELSADNFKTEVFESGKNAFVKFLAPWRRRAEGMKGSAMKPDKKAWLLKRINVLKGLSA